MKQMITLLFNQEQGISVKNFLLFLTLLFFPLVLEAHKINAYNIIYIEERGDMYGTEVLVANYFTKLGFRTVTSDELEEMNSTDKIFLLKAVWNLDMTQGGYATGEASTCEFALYDVTGTEILKLNSIGYYGLLWGPKSISKNLFKAIFKQIDRLKYKFNPNLNKAATEKSPRTFASWTEDSVMNYLRNKRITSIEGVYKNYSNNMDYYKIAILKEKEKYYGIILETDNKRWNKGDTKIVLSPIENNIYDIDYYDFKGKKYRSIGQYENRLLRFSMGSEMGSSYELQFVKVFPNQSSANTENNPNLSEENLKSTGSGFVISGNIVATNHHVIENSNSIKVVLSIGGMLEEFNARILSVDKVNDIALLTIKDKKFTPLQPAPYNIIHNTLDVGTSVFTMGYPLSHVLGKEIKVTDGLISSKTGYDGNAVTYQISAPIQPGNSGGPLFDKKGNLVGITNAGIPSADNVGYAIKSSYLLNLIDSAPIDIVLPKGENMPNKELTSIIKKYTPYIALIKVYE